MERGSDKVSPRQDDELKHETEGLIRSGRQTHAEEWKEVEPAGEDQPDATRDPEGALTGGTPPGMSAEDVEGRSELATYLGQAPYPVVREQVIELLIDNNAPDRLVDRARQLPSGRTFDTVNDVWETLGGGVERQRF